VPTECSLCRYHRFIVLEKTFRQRNHGARPTNPWRYVKMARPQLTNETPPITVPPPQPPNVGVISAAPYMNAELQVLRDIILCSWVNRSGRFGYL